MENWPNSILLRTPSIHFLGEKGEYAENKERERDALGWVKGVLGSDNDNYSRKNFES
jgi:hypothetical protein